MTRIYNENFLETELSKLPAISDNGFSEKVGMKICKPKFLGAMLFAPLGIILLSLVALFSPIATILAYASQSIAQDKFLTNVHTTIYHIIETNILGATSSGGGMIFVLMALLCLVTYTASD